MISREKEREECLEDMISCSSSPLIISILYIIFIYGLLSVLFFCVVVLLAVSLIYSVMLCVLFLSAVYLQNSTPPLLTKQRYM